MYIYRNLLESIESVLLAAEVVHYLLFNTSISVLPFMVSKSTGPMDIFLHKLNFIEEKRTNRIMLNSKPPISMSAVRFVYIDTDVLLSSSK